MAHNDSNGRVGNDLQPRRGPVRILARALGLAVVLLVVAGPVHAQTIQGTAVIVARPDGDSVDATVTFDLPRAAWVGGGWWIVPDLSLVGVHTCEILAAQTYDITTGEVYPGNARLFARFQKRRKGSVFIADLPLYPENSLYNAGCDGDPATIDKFQGSLAAIYAAPSLNAALAMGASSLHPDGLTVEQEMRDFFDIDPFRSQILYKLYEFHGAELLNRGGSATGVASAQLSVRFSF